MLQKSNIAIPVLWALLAFITTRVLLTPLLHAGVFTSLHQASGPRGTTFISGSRCYGGSFIWLYLLRLALTSIPFYWAIPAVRSSLANANSYVDLSIHLLPWLFGIAVYGSLLKLIFTYILFALTSERPILHQLMFSLKHLLPISGLALSVFGITFLLNLLVLTLSLYWAGFFSIVVYLAYPLLQIWLKVWAIAVQYRFWSEAKG